MPLDNNIETTGKTVTRGVAISGFGNVAVRFLDFGIAVLILRWLSIYEYGIYKLALASYEVFSGFFLAGLESVVISDVSRDLKANARSAKTLFSFYFFFMVAVGVIFWAVFFFGGKLVAGWIGRESAGEYLKIVSFIFLLTPFETVYKMKFQVFLDFGWANIIKVLSDLARFILIIVLFYFYSFGISGALWSYLAPMAFLCTASFIFYRKETLITIPAFGELKAAASSLFLKHGKWAIASDYINNFNQSIRPFIVKAFVGTEAVAIISVAQNLISAIKSLFPLREVLTPVLPRSTDNPERLVSQINRATKYATFGYLIVGLAAAIGTPVFINIFFPKYMPALPYFYLFLLGTPFYGFRSVALPVFYALKKQQTLMIITSSRLIATTVLTVILTYFFGLWGAAAEGLIVGILMAPAYGLAIRKILPQWKFSWNELVSIDDYDRRFLKDTKDKFLAKIGLGLKSI